MAIFQRDIILDTKVYIRAIDVSTAERMWLYHKDASLDLADPQWVDISSDPCQINLRGPYRIRGVASGSKLRSVREDNVRTDIETVSAKTDQVLRPRRCLWPELRTITLDVTLTASAYIRKARVSDAEATLENIERTDLDLPDAWREWLTLDGLESEMLPMIISRNCRVGGETESGSRAIGHLGGQSGYAPRQSVVGNAHA